MTGKDIFFVTWTKKAWIQIKKEFRQGRNKSQIVLKSSSKTWHPLPKEKNINR
jgi:hypothetical protein